MPSDICHENYEESYNFLLVGASNVGKTVLALRYVSNVFVEDHEETIEDVYQAKYQDRLINIIDTSGEKQFGDTNIGSTLFTGDAYLLMYSVNDRESFDKLYEIVTIFKTIRRSRNIPCVVVATKIDLSTERSVTLSEGLSLANELSCPFFETSAQSSFNVNEVFDNLMKQIYQAKEMTHKSGRERSTIQKFVSKSFNSCILKWKHKIHN